MVKYHMSPIFGEFIKLKIPYFKNQFDNCQNTPFRTGHNYCATFGTKAVALCLLVFSKPC